MYKPSGAPSIPQTVLLTKQKQILTWEEAQRKAEVLVGQMSLEQKVNMVTGMGWGSSKCVGNTYGNQDPYFPSLCLQDGPLGIRFSDNTTAHVAGITAAASFDKALLYKRAHQMGQESYAKGVHYQLGPCLDIYRSPYGGRGWEAFGEDPFLQGVAGALTVQGIQDAGVVATAKHFLLNNQEVNRTASSSNVDERTLHEIYAWPYARAIEAGVGAVMCSYNLINGTYACENEYTINTVLKKEMGFQGVVMTDWGAHHSTQRSANAGLDMSMPGDITFNSNTSYWGLNLTDAVRHGSVDTTRVDDMALRIATVWYKMGQDKNFPETTLSTFNRSAAPFVPVQDDHHTIVRQIGAAGVVLLRNDGILPLSRHVSKIALIGSDAGPNPKGLNACPDQGCNQGTLGMGWGSGSVDYPYIVTPTQGIAARAGRNTEIALSYNDYDLATAAYVAKRANVAIVFSSADSGENYITVDDNPGDRKNLSLWNNGDALIQAVADANANTIVVIHSVGPVLMPWIDHPNIRAIVWPNLPSQETGNSLADVLFGDINPSGRLPYTIARREADYNVRISTDNNIVYSERLEVGYRHFDAKNIEPLFPFGHGLSYTHFNYSKLTLKINRTEGHIIASVTLKNVGKMDGAEVVQAYIGFPEAAAEPPKVLRGFEKIYLKAGKKTTFDMRFTKTELSIWDTALQDWTVPSGEFSLFIGASSRDIRQTAKFIL
ncbi:beta-glucosidase [Dichotomocladium elegans]|nr:beta-glucosidase [Dichotomocladium elegans]